MSEWRTIKCADVDWFCAGGSRRAAHKVRYLCRNVDAPTVYDTPGEWSQLTLGQLADMGVRAWTYPTGMGVAGVDVIKRVIDAAAAGQDVTKALAPDAYVPRIEREAPITNPAFRVKAAS